MNIELRGVTYEIEEASVGDMMPIFDLMQTDPKQFQIELTRRVVKIDGVPLGADLEKMPMSLYMELVNKVMDAQGFGSDEGKT